MTTRGVAEAPRAAVPAPDEKKAEQGGRRGVWQTAKRWLLPAFAVVVLGMLASHARDVDWAGAWKAVRAYEAGTLWTAGALAAASYLLYGCFDLIGRRYTGHGLPALRTWTSAAVSYAFNLNLGSLVGSLGMRWRLYSRAGLDNAQISDVIVISLVTNWLGYGALGGLLFASGVIELPPDFSLSSGMLRLIGVAMLLVVGAYLAACGFSRRREGTLFGHRFRLPSGRMALLQLVLAMLNWAVIGSVVYVLMKAQQPYPTVLAVLLTAAIAGVATHIPAGLGVIEAVFLSLLAGGAMPQSAILGALLAYRAIYYLLPLCFAIAAYFVLEGLGRSDGAGADADAGAADSTRQDAGKPRSG